jgi:kynurenine formamidase
MRLNPQDEASAFPKRAELPHISGTPKGAAWFWGGNDELGRLNLLTPERKVRAAQENVKTGASISLDLPLDVPGPALGERKGLQHHIKAGHHGDFDDEVTYNTQCSSQWDGFRHYGHPIHELHYNGIAPDEIAGGIDTSGEDGENTSERSRKLGIDAWAKHGIVGRGVLLDIYSWAQKEGKTYDPYTTHNITADDLRACAKAQNVTFQTGDILVVRTGWTLKYHSLSPAEKEEQSKRGMMEHCYAGLEASDSMKDFLHDTYFAAAASDNLALEAWPPSSLEGSLHANMLALWGMPMGELWDLEALSEKCKELKRWTFLLTSSPINVPGGIGSPPNAIALF